MRIYYNENEPSVSIVVSEKLLKRFKREPETQTHAYNILAGKTLKVYLNH